MHSGQDQSVGQWVNKSLHRKQNTPQQAEEALISNDWLTADEEEKIENVIEGKEVRIAFK